MTVTNEQLVIACQQNNRQAQKIVFEKYAGKLMVMCHRYFALEKSENILSEIFCDAFERLSGTTESVVDLLGFLKNVSLEHIKKEITDFDANLYEGQSSAALPEDFELDINAQKLLQIMQQLDNTKRFVVNFKVFESLSFEEISQILKINKDDAERIYNIAIHEIIEQATKKDVLNELKEEGVAQQV